MTYLLDSNTLIQAKNFHYSFSICPGYWDWLNDKADEGTVSSIQRIKQELLDGDSEDELELWLGEGSRVPFHGPDTETIVAMREVTTWVMEQDYNENERSRFFAKADPLLIAYAKAHGKTIVTNETLVPDHSKKVKIPNVCQAMEVPYVTPFRLLDLLGAKFIQAS